MAEAVSEAMSLEELVVEAETLAGILLDTDEEAESPVFATASFWLTSTL